MNGKELAICKGPCCWEQLLFALNHSLARFVKGARQSVSGSQVRSGPCRREMGISGLWTNVFSDLWWIIYTLSNPGSLLGQCNQQPVSIWLWWKLTESCLWNTSQMAGLQKLQFWLLLTQDPCLEGTLQSNSWIQLRSRHTSCPRISDGLANWGLLSGSQKLISKSTLSGLVSLIVMALFLIRVYPNTICFRE